MRDTTNMADNSSSLSLLAVLKPGGSFHIGTESRLAVKTDLPRVQGSCARMTMGVNSERFSANATGSCWHCSA